MIYTTEQYSSSTLNRFLSADTIVPDFSNPQSLNRYTYVLNSPLRFVDPTGHYGKDVHLKLTGKIARFVGEHFGMENANALAVTISEANQGVDENWLTSPAFVACRPISDFGETTYTSPTNYYHFKGREEVIERLYYAIEQGDAEMFGRGLHSYQDTFSHSGEGYSNYAGIFGMIELYRECPDCFKDNPVRSGFRSYFQLGHLFAGKTPDTYHLSNLRDVYMTNGTEFWITLFLLNEAGIDPGIYFQEQFSMSPEEWYKENVGEDLNGQN